MSTDQLDRAWNGTTGWWTTTNTCRAVRLASVEHLARYDESGRRMVLASLLADLEEALPMFSEVISQSYLSHAQMPRQLSRLER